MSGSERASTVISHSVRVALAVAGIAMLLVAAFPPSHSSAPGYALVTIGVVSALVGAGSYAPPGKRTKRRAARAEAAAPVAAEPAPQPSALARVMGFPVSLLVAVLPITLPAFAVLVVGSKLLGAWREVALAAVAIIVALLVWRSERRDLDGAIFKPLVDHPVGVAVTILSVLGLLVVFGFYADRSLALGREIGGSAGLGIALACLLWIVAIPLRLLSFGSSYLRLVAVVGVGVGVAGLLVRAGSLPGKEGFRPLGGGWWLPWLVVLGVVVVVPAAIEAGCRLRGALEPLTRRRFDEFVRVIRSVGFVASSLAALMLLVALLGAMFATGAAATTGADLSAPADPSIPPQPGGRPLTDAQLEAVYLPILAYTHHELWEARRVDWFLRDVFLHPIRERRGHGYPVSLASLPRRSVSVVHRAGCSTAAKTVTAGGRACTPTAARTARAPSTPESFGGPGRVTVTLRGSPFLPVAS
jgi:hypothetical protein